MIYSRSLKPCLKDENIEIYSVSDKGKSEVKKCFFRTLTNKIYKYMTATSKNMYLNEFPELADEHSNTIHRLINVNPDDVKSNTYIDFDFEFNMEKPNFKVGGHGIILKYKNTFEKGNQAN